VNRRHFTLSLLTTALLAGVVDAQPQPAATAHVEVLVLEASSGNGGIDPQLANIPQLRQPPLNTWNQITLVSRTTIPLGAAPSNTGLPDGATVRVSLGGRGADGRYTVNVAIVRGAQTSNMQFVAAVGEPFFTVRSGRPEHASILGFIVRP
jgi:hypothetical protein